jgi:sulfoxide reductase heme-binding subunit YedZ
MTTTDLVWVFARSAGTAALVALVLSVLSGMALRSGALAWLSHNRAVQQLHYVTSVVWVPLAVAHVIALMLDPYSRIGFVDVIVPFLVPYGSFAIGLGTVSLELIIVVLVSTWMRSSLSPQGWLAIHRLSYVAIVAAFAHGLLAGTDFAQPLVSAVVWLTASMVIVVGFRRLKTSRAAQKETRPAASSGPHRREVAWTETEPRNRQ